MIAAQDIRDRTAEWSLPPETVEKDYVLGWLLAALAEHPIVRTYWVFKGGTCLRKCFFETYRFSEDLDFSLRPESPYTTDAIRGVLVQVTERAAELAGIGFLPEELRVDERRDKLGRATFQARAYYRGPLLRPGHPQRILLDITAHEPILSEPTLATIFHPYPDALPDLLVPTYSIEEMVAEKTRALYERTRPRDLYDVVFLIENHAPEIDLVRSRVLFGAKCRSKGFEPPGASALYEQIRSDEELRAEWSNMLAHQLPALPKLDDMLVRAAGLLAWIEADAAPQPSLPRHSFGRADVLFAPAGIQFVSGGSALETIRFAGANRLLLEFNYSGRRRRVEPYSLRRPKTGNLLLYAWERESGQIKAFKIAEIHQSTVTDETFRPRYRVEFSAPITHRSM